MKYGGSLRSKGCEEMNRWMILCWGALVVFMFAAPLSSRAAESRVLLDTAVDGWSLWTMYGPGMNATYGAGNNSKHYYHPQHVISNGTERVLRAIDITRAPGSYSVTNRYQAGALSTREAPNGAGFFRFSNDISSLRFEFEITISDWNHAVWPACWLRGVGGASKHEIDILEGMTAQTGTNLYHFAVHSAGHINAIMNSGSGVPLLAGQRAIVWAEVHRPGTLNASNVVIRAGVADLMAVSAEDRYTAQWWTNDYGWDLIANEQIGGNYIGDPDKDYDGTLQNGTTGLPPAEVPNWQGDSSMTVHRVRVIAALDRLTMDRVWSDAGLVHVAFESWKTRSYDLEAANDLTFGSWTSLLGGTLHSGVGGPDIFEVPAAAPVQFYRLREQK